jgi:hypothetical protein
MVEGNDAFIQNVRRVLKGRPHCVRHMVEGNDAFIQNVRRALEGRLLCV